VTGRGDRKGRKKAFFSRKRGRSTAFKSKPVNFVETGYYRGKKKLLGPRKETEWGSNPRKKKEQNPEPVACVPE